MNKLKAATLLPLVLLVSLLTLVACTPDKKTVSANEGELPLLGYTVQGYPLQCVRSFRNDVRALSCNWEKYNRLVDACEAASKERRTVVTKEGETLIFPAVKGGC